MLTISGLGYNYPLAKDAGTSPSPDTSMTLYQAQPAAGMFQTQQQQQPSGCQAPDVMSEYGCLTAKVPMPGSSSWNVIYGCPPGSEPYSASHCLRTSGEISMDTNAWMAPIPAQAATDAVVDAAAAQAAADAQANADAAVDAATADADGSSPSPGMMVTPVEPTQAQAVPMWSVADERKRWYKWGAIGAGVIGAGVLVALLARR